MNYKDELGLIVGMKSEDGKDTITLIDSDKYCYQVLSKSKGATGIRTIPKVIVKEWIDFLKSSGSTISSEKVREELKGKTIVDRYEYGYAATIQKLALMALGQLKYVFVDVSEIQCQLKMGNSTSEIKETVDIGSVSVYKDILFDEMALSDLIDALKTAGLQYDDAFVKRFVCALLAKPFVILTGLSGSGKTKLAQAFTTWLAKENSLIVPVGADWTNNEHLLGYPDALQPGNYVMPDTGVLDLILRANEKSDEPFFLILDEMNLSHVERYFSDFLSAMESKDKDAIKLYDGDERSANGKPIPRSLGIPQNLFVIGTMNVDETTYMFSPKVLDRAQVLEFRVSKDDMASFLGEPKPVNLVAIENQGYVYAKGFRKLSAEMPELEEGNKTIIAKMLTTFFEPLEKIGAEFGYRTASEIMRFCAYYLWCEASIDEALDATAMQKLLPKLHGSQAKLGPVLEALAELCKNAPNGVSSYTHTLEKIARMQDRLEVGFTSFAEA